MTKRSIFLPLCTLALLSGCGASVQVPNLKTADQAAGSPTAQDSKKDAPQAYAQAEALRKEAHDLADEGEAAAAKIKAEEAILAYKNAFTILRGARAQVRIEDADTKIARLEEELAELDLTQAKINRETDIFELQARIHLDTEAVKDVRNISPERARARRQAAVFLGSEAEVLCIGAALIRGEKYPNTKAGKDAARLQVELEHGSIREDLYPRSASLRAACLTELTLARRPKAKESPASAAADRLLKDLSEASYLPYRDDRGVVVQLTAGSNEDAWKYLGQVAKAHKEFSLLLLVHGKRGQARDSLEPQGEKAKNALEAAGASEVTVQLIGSHQPVVDPKVRGAEKKNARIELIFIHPGR